ncbi:tetratricopeptide repeat protein [candidate division KSB3 bacterium]|uniref:Tetratricopeptide repeat protein n=1 Tax=candidate division KSB3 bacterium TaxID=2044937 RepID=A0A9D5JU96_9BACT|nr:tetratricopeptide repeat protein [candidate division KSB3 bacterium]
MSWLLAIVDHPLVLIGGVCVLVLGMFRGLLRSGVLRQVTSEASERVIQHVLRYGFWLALCVTLGGFGFAAWNTYMEKTAITHYGVSPERFEALAGELAVTKSALKSFFKILEQQQVPLEDLDSKLREIAANYKELVQRLRHIQSEDPQVIAFKEQASAAIEAGRYQQAEDLLNQAEDADMAAIRALQSDIQQRQKALEQRQLSAAETTADNARLQRIQLRYAQAARYWQKAAALLPEEHQKTRGFYLHEAGYDYHRIARYDDALPLWEQSLAIQREIGDRAGEGATLNNLAGIAHARGDYATALTYLEQSLAIQRELGNRAGEGTTLNNLSQIYDARGDYATALTYLEQSLAIRREIGNKAGEAVTSLNIGQIYLEQGDLSQAEKYIRRTVEIQEKINHPDLKQAPAALQRLQQSLQQQENPPPP